MWKSMPFKRRSFINENSGHAEGRKKNRFQEARKKKLIKTMSFSCLGRAGGREKNWTPQSAREIIWRNRLKNNVLDIGVSLEPLS